MRSKSLIFIGVICCCLNLNAQDVEDTRQTPALGEFSQLFSVEEIDAVDDAIREADPGSRLRDARVNMMSQLVKRTLSERPFFAISSASELGLTMEQVNIIKDVGPFQTRAVLGELGFSATDASDFYLSGDDSEFARNLGNVANLMRKEEDRQVRDVDQALNADQRKAVRRLYFESQIDRDPTRALLAVGAKPSEEIQRSLHKVMNRDVTSEQRRKDVMALISKTPYGIKVSRLLGEELPRSISRKKAETQVSRLRFFGDVHPHLRYANPPRAGTKCPHCEIEFEDADVGFQMGPQFFHEHCFVTLVVRKNTKDAVKRRNPRRD